MNRLFLCEKPSQAKDIAKVLGTPSRKEGYIDVGSDKVTWCVGHLYELAEPADYDEGYKSWSLATLPIAPAPWKLAPKRGVGKQIAVIRKLLGATSNVVIATDPDREGEVIAREVLDEFHYQGNVTRLLLSALDAKSVQKGLSNIRPGSETEKLYYAGMGRARSDWLVGMNLTRAYTCVARSQGVDAVFSVGRVQTPTLALVVARDQAIAKFVPSEYFTVELECVSQGQSFPAKWVPSDEQKERICDSEGRCTNQQSALEVAQSVSNATAQVSFADRQTKRVKALLPFSLSQLQQITSKRWGYGAKETLKIAQSLYEKHKATTYPRTDCAYLPEEQLDEADQVLASLAQSFSGRVLAEQCGAADLSIKSRTWNNKKISAHHAIIPTTQPCDLSAMTDAERDVFELIARHYLIQFYPDHVFDETTLELMVGDNKLKSVGKSIQSAGWHQVIKPSTKEAPAEIPLLQIGDTAQTGKAGVSARKTKPPARYTEGTLIKAMTNIASSVDDPESKKILKENDGIGTEATRGDIIQTLKDRKYIKTAGKSLVSTETGQGLVSALPTDLCDPVTTALMERLLTMVANGDMTLDDYMNRQLGYVTALVNQAIESGADQMKGIAGNVKTCPKCSKPLRKRKSKFSTFLGCSGYPECDYIEKKGGAKTKPEKTDKICPDCGKPLLKRKGRKGHFLGCSGFPDCKHTELLN